ncbi:hypothetical protein [Sphingomonas faeni]|jgi:hypothetical protein|uniref:hypothetical protein n=1 Tax=Sphingomonas faeni TaxID=185950 RepID=UPI0033514B03
MTKFQRLTVAFLAIMCLALTVGVGFYVYRSSKAPVLSHEEQLDRVCKLHPADCALMKQANAAVAATSSSAVRTPTPGVMNSVDRLGKMKMDMESNFIATGRYGDAKSSTGNSDKANKRLDEIADLLDEQANALDATVEDK